MLNVPYLLPLFLTLAAVVCIAVLLLFLFYRRKNKHGLVLKASSDNHFNLFSKSLITKKSYSAKIDVFNRELEPFGFAYYPKQDLFYSVMNGWQRECGYCKLYDEGSAPLCMIIDCEPIRFEYAGKRWLIEFWKGQYGMTTGCEIGIYSTTGSDLNIPGVFDGTFYYCAKDEDHLPLFFELQKDGKVLFTRNEVHWWLTGFRLGEFSKPSDLSMIISLTLKDSDMLHAFLESFRKTGYTENEYTVMGNTVRFIYHTPHSPQPLSRTPVTEYLAQSYNQRNCEAYQYATQKYYNPLDKLELVKMQAPKMYQKIINVGSTKEIFSSYKIIRNFIDPDK